MSTHDRDTTAPATLYPVDCPTWCEGTHPSFLTPDATPDPGLSDFVMHETTLALDDLVLVSFAIAEELSPTEPEGPCFVRVFERGTHGTRAMLDGTPEDLRRWARVLLDAADKADTMGDRA